MAQLASGVRVARRLAASASKTIEVMGPSIQFLTPLEEGNATPEENARVGISLPM
jgi:hypothetical protein